jgi:hypothetical protein
MAKQRSLSTVNDSFSGKIIYKTMDEEVEATESIEKIIGDRVVSGPGRAGARLNPPD